MLIEYLQLGIKERRLYMDQDFLKAKAAKAALNYVHDGMCLGLGTGSTANKFIKLLAKRIEAGLNVQAVSTSQATSDLCADLGIKLYEVNDIPRLDLVIDGADELTADLQLVKGGGGALLREKIIAQFSNKLLIIADETKLVSHLGAFPLPIEINQFGAQLTASMCQQLFEGYGLEPKLAWRKNQQGELFITDGGHYILDVLLKSIGKLGELNEKLLSIAGVVEHGLFLNMADLALVATRKDGLVLLKRVDNSVISTYYDYKKIDL